MKQWAFYNSSDAMPPVIVEAVDGHRAWEILTRRFGVRRYDGSYYIPTPNSWSIACVCPCCNIQNTTFCSKECVENVS